MDVVWAVLLLLRIYFPFLVSILVIVDVVWEVNQEGRGFGRPRVSILVIVDVVWEDLDVHCLSVHNVFQSLLLWMWSGKVLYI